MNNVKLNDEEIGLVNFLINKFRDGYIVPETKNHGASNLQQSQQQLEIRLKQLERKMKRAFEDPKTEFV